VEGVSHVQSNAQSGDALPPHDFTSNWADLSAVPGATTSWAHHGLAVTSEGELIGFHAGQLVAFDREGRVRRVVRAGLTEGHGITVVREGDEEYLWITDPGFVHVCSDEGGDDAWAPLFGKGVHVDSREPRVVKMTLNGEIRAELPIPPMDAASGPSMMGAYCPCGSTVDEERFGGNGDIWVADGYGSSLVHRFDRHGNHVSVLTGEEGGGRFICPHAVFIDRRPHKTPELYIADRENKRVQVYDLEGRYRRTIGEGFLSSPSGFVQWGDVLVVAELYSRLAVLDADDRLVGYIGATPDGKDSGGWPERPGWPNALSDAGYVKAPHLTDPNRFNSPHSIAVDNDGNLFVSEWLIGGRYSKLALQATPSGRDAAASDRLMGSDRAE
jgi:sugar lactone lactonase YvrE